ALTVGNIVEFIVYVAYLTWPVASFGFTVNRFQQAMASWKRIDHVLQKEIEVVDSPKTNSNIESIEGKIEFKNVSFKYPESETFALKDISFTIEPGQNAAIVGRTGSGKTSIVQLLPRLYNVTEGVICIDGMNINEIPLSVLRSNIGLVPQDTFLFSSTIAENIAFGTLEASQKQIEQAAERAQVRENILQFDKKFETI